MARTKEKKKSKIGDSIYTILIIILLLVMGFSAFKVYTIYSKYKKGTDVYNEIAEDVGADNPVVDIDTRLNLDWGKLKGRNSDVQAWMRSVGTLINYPVVKGRDNEYYLNHLMDGTVNDKGTLFIDAYCEHPFEDFLTIIYGHRMRDESMFCTLGEYFEERDTPYFLEHPVIEFYTPAQDYDLEIFGAAVIDSRDGSKYNFSLYEETAIQEYIDWIFTHNELYGYDNRVSVVPTDHIVMLSTCTLRGSANDDNRVVIWGKLSPVNKKDN